MEIIHTLCRLYRPKPGILFWKSWEMGFCYNDVKYI
jgi:hypothetical protein